MGNNVIHLVSENILEEIERKKDVLKNMSDYSLSNSIYHFRKLKSESLRHSCSLELVGLEGRTTGGMIRKKKRILRECIDNLSNALQWGENNYKGNLTEEFIKTIGYLIEPWIYSQEGYADSPSYRTGRVRPLGATCTPPGPEKLEREMQSFISENSGLENAIDKAVHAHLHIARIHPFEDGNGRTSRLVQNIILEKSGYAPIIVSAYERREYGTLIDNAVYSYKMKEGKMSSEQNAFYNFLALKIISALDTELKYSFDQMQTKKRRN